ncbi:MAG: F0F1 ATP synthase subunit delta [Candidatus Saccharimonadales bacterium]
MKEPRTQISQMIASKVLKSGSSKKLLQEIAALLLFEHRVGDLDSILRDVQNDWANNGYVEVLATSAFPLDKSTKLDIEKRIKKYYPNAKRIIVTEIRDPEIIGGVRLNLADKQLDLSIEAKLNKFKHLTSAGKDV